MTIEQRIISRRRFLSYGAGLAASAVVAAEPLAGSRWQIGCYTRPWNEYDYRVALDGIAEAGFKFAGLMTVKGGVLVSVKTAPEQVAAIAAEAKARGLKIASIFGGDFMVKKTVADGITNLKLLIDHVARCECPSLMLGGTSRPELVDDYYKVVAECCDYAAAHGVGLTIKPHGGSNSTGPECRRLIEKVNHKSFRLWYDPGNIYYYSDGKADPVGDATTVDGLVVGMSVKDFLPPKNINLTPGAGQVDFAKVFAHLQRGGFRRGPLIVECLAGGDVAYITAEARKARRFVEHLVV